jgi:integral membrane protein
MNQKLINNFGIIALLEGISCVLLFCITMPLKYFYGMKELSYWTGLAHGVLFITYVVMLLLCAVKYKWSAKRVILYGLASLIPFATFAVERNLKQDPLQQKNKI